MRFLTYMLLMMLAGCSWRVPGIVSPASPATVVFSEVKSIPSVQSTGKETRLTVVIERPQGTHRTQAVPVWDQVDLSLSHATLLSATLNKTISQAGGGSVSAAFMTLRPGSGYSLTVNLRNAGVLKAQGTQIGITLTSGANAIVISLSRIYSVASYAGTTNPGPGIFAINWALNNPSGVTVDSSGKLYLIDGQYVRKVDTDGSLSTVAGNGIAAFSGDGAAATNAALNGPFAMAADGSGNLYIADTYNHRIRKVDASGTISTVAGNGTAGFSGDGAAATNAKLYRPSDVAVDGSGNLYIADTYNNRIRKVDTNGTISTVAGNGTAGFSGDGAAATSAALNYPSGLTVDGSGNLYLADRLNNRVRKVTIGGLISTVAGNGTAGYLGDGAAATSAALNVPNDVAVDASDNLYIADLANHRIRKVTTGGIISTLAGTGTAGYSGDGAAATSAALNTPYSVIVDGSGNLYVADQGNKRIRKVNTGGIISTVTGNGSSSYSGEGVVATSAQLSQPYGATLDGSGNLYIIDQGNNRIRKVDTSGTISTVAGNGTAGFSGDGAAATSAQISHPSGVAMDGSGNLYIADTFNHRIRKVDTSGAISTVAGNGTAGFSGDGGAATSAQLFQPYGVTVDNSSNLYIADQGNKRIRKVNTSGIISTVAGNGIQTYSGDGGAATSAALNGPCAIAVDGSGNLFIVDQGNCRIRKVNTGGIISTIAGNGAQGYSGDGGAATGAALNTPFSVTVDDSGNLYIADYMNYRIRMVNTGGTISTIAGNGTYGYSGETGTATSMPLYPCDVDVDSSGNLYITDSGNNRIRKAI